MELIWKLKLVCIYKIQRHIYTQIKLTASFWILPTISTFQWWHFVCYSSLLLEACLPFGFSKSIFVLMLFSIILQIFPQSKFMQVLHFSITPHSGKNKPNPPAPPNLHYTNRNFIGEKFTLVPHSHFVRMITIYLCEQPENALYYQWSVLPVLHHC